VSEKPRTWTLRGFSEGYPQIRQHMRNPIAPKEEVQVIELEPVLDLLEHLTHEEAGVPILAEWEKAVDEAKTILREHGRPYE
jgi:hypothetical protein